MHRHPHMILYPVVIILFCLVSLCQLARADDEVPAVTPVPVEVAGELVRDQAVTDDLPDGRFFADGEALVTWWEAMDWDFADKPDIAFEESLLIIEYRDAADPNEVHWGGRLNDAGELEVMGMATLMGFEPSDEVKLTFLVVPREGVEAIVHNVQKVGDDGQVTFERVVYSIGEEDGAIVRPMEVVPTQSIFDVASRDEPVELTSAEDAAECFDAAQLAMLNDEVDWEGESVLIFAWRGSGQDQMAAETDADNPDTVRFIYTPGPTRDLRPHVYVFAINAGVVWEADTPQR